MLRSLHKVFVIFLFLYITMLSIAPPPSTTQTLQPAPKLLRAGDLRKLRDEREARRNAQYNEILRSCQQQIERANERDADNIFCKIPYFKLGRPPIRNLNACLVYVLLNLKRNGFRVSYFYPDVLFICWGDSKRALPEGFAEVRTLPARDPGESATSHIPSHADNVPRSKEEKLAFINKTVCRQLPGVAAQKTVRSAIYDDDAFSSIRLLADRIKKK